MSQGQAGGSGPLSIATGIFALNLLPLGWAVLVMMTLEGLSTIVLETAPRVPMVFLFTCLVLHGALRMLSSGGRVSGFDATLSPAGGFPWSFVIRTLILSVPGALVALMIAGLILPGGGVEIALLAGTIGGIAANALVFSLFGTMLIEIAEGRDGDPEAALDAGRARFPGGFWLILAGPGVAELCLFLFDLAARLVGLDTRIAEAGAAHLSPDGIVVDAVLYAGAAFVSIAMAAALHMLNGQDANGIAGGS